MARVAVAARMQEEAASFRGMASAIFRVPLRPHNRAASRWAMTALPDARSTRAQTIPSCGRAWAALSISPIPTAPILTYLPVAPAFSAAGLPVPIVHGARPSSLTAAMAAGKKCANRPRSLVVATHLPPAVPVVLPWVSMRTTVWSAGGVLLVTMVRRTMDQRVATEMMAHPEEMARSAARLRRVLPVVIARCSATAVQEGAFVPRPPARRSPSMMAVAH